MQAQQAAAFSASALTTCFESELKGRLKALKTSMRGAKGFLSLVSFIVILSKNLSEKYRVFNRE